MFSCCLPSCGGCGFRKAKKKSLFSHYRHWLGPHLHRVWSFVRMSSQSCTQEVVEELADGFGYSISLDRDQLHRTIINNQGCSEVPSTLHPGRCPHPLWDTWRQLGPLCAGCWRTAPPPKVSGL
nr:CMT1A duplicated region transcript 15 protein-like protein [Equus asinus]